MVPGRTKEDCIQNEPRLSSTISDRLDNARSIIII